jgi:uncharacterized membrane protein
MSKTSLAKGLSVALSVILGLAILASIGAIIYIANDPNAGEKFTEFYLLGPGGKAENYPGDIALGQSAPVLLGIVNREKQPATYSFSVLVDNITIYSKEAISLQNDGKWEGEVPVKPLAIGENQKVEFSLYKDNAATPYLNLHLFVNVKQGSGQ